MSASEVRKLLRFGRGKDFDRWVAEQPLFPKPVEVGKTAAGKPRLLWPKSKVLAFIDLLRG